ncbi:hypothetical protein E0485_13165 [Paenibacillus albiflavus]|uniref:Uncharacterized protein n=1 Tax=Paenibacillus albiflavus TaxID=2545760 RepID=A0A4R4EB65_9BACL|nr:hypothetical protein [Paenibacillus albiflavus]TCZ76547.1 hypothetical protein E0485_13165 [Paenibacillus albiflavus]
MNSFTHYAMPMYTHDHQLYWRQMHDWHMKMYHYHEQLKAHHMEMAKHFKKMMDERVLTAGESIATNDNVA